MARSLTYGYLVHGLGAEPRELLHKRAPSVVSTLAESIRSSHNSPDALLLVNEVGNEVVYLIGSGPAFMVSMNEGGMWEILETQQDVESTAAPADSSDIYSFGMHCQTAQPHFSG